MAQDHPKVIAAQRFIVAFSEWAHAIQHFHLVLPLMVLPESAAAPKRPEENDVDVVLGSLTVETCQTFPPIFLLISVVFCQTSVVDVLPYS